MGMYYIMVMEGLYSLIPYLETVSICVCSRQLTGQHFHTTEYPLRCASGADRL